MHKERTPPSLTKSRRPKKSKGGQNVTPLVPPGEGHRGAWGGECTGRGGECGGHRRGGVRDDDGGSRGLRGCDGAGRREVAGRGNRCTWLRPRGRSAPRSPQTSGRAKRHERGRRLEGRVPPGSQPPAQPGRPGRETPAAQLTAPSPIRSGQSDVWNRVRHYAERRVGRGRSGAVKGRSHGGRG